MKRQFSKDEKTRAEWTIYEMKRHCRSVRDIAARIHKRESYVRGVLSLNGWNDLGRPEIMAMRDSGMSIKAIARKMCIDERLVSAVVHGRKIK